MKKWMDGWIDIGYREEFSDRCMNGWKEGLKERLEEERKEKREGERKRRGRNESCSTKLPAPR